MKALCEKAEHVNNRSACVPRAPTGKSQAEKSANHSRRATVSAAGFECSVDIRLGCCCLDAQTTLGDSGGDMNLPYQQCEEVFAIARHVKQLGLEEEKEEVRNGVNLTESLVRMYALTSMVNKSLFSAAGFFALAMVLLRMRGGVIIVLMGLGFVGGGGGGGGGGGDSGC
jgi:hypothetical protein